MSHKILIILKTSLVVFVLSLICNQLVAQSTNGIFFQAVARDNFSNPAKDRKIYVQSSIIQTTPTGTKVLTEEHQANTDATGVFSISLGNGVRVGGTASGLATIDWSNGPFYLNLKVAITPIGGNNAWDYAKEWIDMGTTSFGAVPFALYSASSAKVDDKLNINDTTKMLAVYAKAMAVQNIATAVDTKLSVKDTLAMLAPYVKATLVLDSFYINNQLKSKVSLADSSIKYITPTQLASYNFSNKAGATIDTSSLSNRINLKANAIDVVSSLDSKANTSDVINSLNLKANTNDLTDGLALKLNIAKLGVANGVATLNSSGIIPSSQLPPVTFSSNYVVASDADMVALSAATVGSIAIRTDINKNYVLNSMPASILANWIELLTPAAPVQTVNGYTGSINLAKSDIGLSNADNTSDLSKPVSNATQAALNLKLDANQLGTASGVASLNALGKIPTDQIPAISFLSVKVLSNQSDMLALSNALVGSVVIRTDLNKNYVLSATPASILANWIELLTPAAPVQTVNGYTGSINLAKSDIGLSNIDNTSDTNKPISSATQIALNLKANSADIATSLALKSPLASPNFTGIPLAPTAISGTNSTQLATTAFVYNATSSIDASSISGTVKVTNGGTGATTLMGLVKGNGTAAFTKAIAGTDYQSPIILTTIGTGSATLSGTTINIPTNSCTIPLGTVSGNMLYWDGSTWTNLPAGSSAQTLTFINGKPIWKGNTTSSSSVPVVYSAGNIWMDRNLGASQVATNVSDVNSYGDYYQWGRNADGHQLLTSSTTSSTSSTDVTSGGLFILAILDWRSSTNDNLWQGVSGVNNPCPTGFRLPTIAEWEQERLSWPTNDYLGAYASPLKLPMAGLRGSDGIFQTSNTSGSYPLFGTYWSSDATGPTQVYTTLNGQQYGSFAWEFIFYSRELTTNNYARIAYNIKSSGRSVRCIMASPNNIQGVDLAGAIPVAKGGTGTSSINGIVKGNGASVMTSALAGVDYSSGTSYLSNGSILKNTISSTSINGVSTNIGTLSTAIAGTDYVAPSSTYFLGTTSIALNRTSASQALTGITSIDGNAATATLAGNITATTNTTLTSISNLNTVGTITSGTISLTTNVKTSGTLTAGTVTYPNTHGTSGQVLTTTGSGTLSWTTPSSGGGSTTHAIGEAYGGGIVFYVWDGGAHGLIGANTELNSGQAISWGGGSGSYVGTTSYYGVLGGKLNTSRILNVIPAPTYGNGDPQSGQRCAAFWAATYLNSAVVVNGVTTTPQFSDWYLPNAYELTLFATQSSYFPNCNFATHDHWSSSERTDYAYLAFALGANSNSYIYQDNKTSTKYVLAIRSF
jgi:hypothetical protein